MTPAVRDIFSHIVSKAYDIGEITGVPTGAQSLFGRPETGSETVFSPSSEVVDIEIIKDDRSIAPMIQRGSIGTSNNSGTKVTALQYRSESRVFPLIELEGIITADQVNKRIPGEALNMPESREMRRRYLASRIYRKHMRQIAGTFEYLAWQSLLTGKQPIMFTADGVITSYDFGRSAGNTITVSAAWNSTSADILGDIEDALTAVQVNGKGLNQPVAGMVVGKAAFDAFLKNSKIQELSNNRRYEQINISIQPEVDQIFGRMTRNGFIARGRLQSSSGWTVYLFTYNHVYNDLAGVQQNYFPADQAMVFDPMMRADRYFGPKESNDMTASRLAWFEETFGLTPDVLSPGVTQIGVDASRVLLPEMFHVDGYPSPDQKSVTIRTQAAPIFAPTAVDQIAVLKGLV